MQVREKKILAKLHEASMWPERDRILRKLSQLGAEDLVSDYFADLTVARMGKHSPSAKKAAARAWSFWQEMTPSEQNQVRKLSKQMRLPTLRELGFHG